MGLERMNSRLDSAVVKKLYQDAKIGSAAGWTVRAAADSFMATCAASTTAGMLVVPLTGLNVGDRIDGYNLVGQIESAGGAVTLDAALYESIAVAAGSTHTAVTGTSMTQITASADKAVTAANSTKTFDESKRVTVAEGKAYFLRLNATTAGSTDIEFLAAVLHVTPVR